MKDEMQYDIQPSVCFLPEERETILNIDPTDKAEDSRRANGKAV